MRQHSAAGEMKAGPRGLLGIDSEAQDLAGREGERHAAPIGSKPDRTAFTLAGGHPHGGAYAGVEHDDAFGGLVAGVIAAHDDTPAVGRGLEGGEHQTVALELEATLDGPDPERLADPQGPGR